jgi:hypothetical protein
MGYYTGINDDGGDGFRSTGGVAVKDSRVIQAEIKVAMMSYQERLDALAASIGTTKYVMLLAKRLAEGDVISRPYGDDRIVVTGRWNEIITKQRELDAAQALLPSLIGLVWPQ